MTSRRWGARLLLLFFSLFWSEGVVLASCPMHESGGAHAAHGARHGESPADDRAPADGTCKCLGSCMGGTPLVVVPIHATESTTVRAAAPRTSAPDSPRDRVTQLRLALAQGPPALG